MKHKDTVQNKKTKNNTKICNANKFWKKQKGMELEEDLLFNLDEYIGKKRSRNIIYSNLGEETESSQYENQGGTQGIDDNDESDSECYVFFCYIQTHVRVNNVFFGEKQAK